MSHHCDITCESGRYADEEIRNLLNIFGLMIQLEEWTDEQLYDTSRRMMKCIECKGEANPDESCEEFYG